MIQVVEKQPKVSLCRKCRGTGKLFNPETQKVQVCDQCEGSGRVMVGAKITFDIRPYRDKQ